MQSCIDILYVYMNIYWFICSSLAIDTAPCVDPAGLTLAQRLLAARRAGHGVELLQLPVHFRQLAS